MALPWGGRHQGGWKYGSHQRPSGAELETMLNPAGGEIYRYRYRGLRLLVASGGRLFLVPAPWRASEGRTPVIPYNDPDTDPAYSSLSSVTRLIEKLERTIGW
jgi:hypothetical protein